MILLGVSGGPDSMYLLYYSAKIYGKANIVVATVNYNFRKDSDIDANIVKNYCLKKGIHFELLNLNENTNKTANLENFAREKRYAFFKEIYDKYNCSKLFLAHHKDDFIETAIMQQGKNRLFYGIRKNNKIFGMNVFRPFVNKYYKDEILKKVNSLKIPYVFDYTNYQPVYERNKIRLKLERLTKVQKERKFKEITKENKNLVHLDWLVSKEFESWEKTNFSQDDFAAKQYKYYLVFKFVHQFFNNINLSSGKINLIINWIQGANRTSAFLLDKNTKMYKKQGFLLKK